MSNCESLLLAPSVRDYIALVFNDLSHLNVSLKISNHVYMCDFNQFPTFSFSSLSLCSSSDEEL